MGKLSYKLTLVTGMAMVAFSGATALAVNPNANAHAADAGKPTVSVPAQADNPSASKGAARLADAKLKACQKRETAINNIMARIVDRGTKQIAVFDTIATRTEAFYTAKGKTVANYDALVLAVGTAKTQAQTDLAAMKTTDSLKCDGTDPKGAVSAFKANLKLEIADLKAYKTAVKNLIVGVKSAEGVDSSTESPKPSASASASAEPSTTPSPTTTPSNGVQE